jgi:hypothetical protein
VRHQTISFIKSGIRIAGYLMMGVLPDVLEPFQPSVAVLMRLTAIVLVVSEAIGIVEEIGHE